MLARVTSSSGRENCDLDLWMLKHMLTSTMVGSLFGGRSYDLSSFVSCVLAHETLCAGKIKRVSTHARRFYGILAHLQKRNATACLMEKCAAVGWQLFCRHMIDVRSPGSPPPSVALLPFFVCTIGCSACLRGRKHVQLYNSWVSSNKGVQH